MGLLARTSFALGWMPDADAVGAPPNALLRMDNCVLDELGIVALRPGSAKVNSSAWTDTDIHSLYTGLLGGTRVRFAGAGNYVYRDGVQQSTVLAGSGDVAFGATQGHVFWARSTTKRSFDGTTEREWGIRMTGEAPDAQPAASGETLALATCTQSAAEFVQDEGTLAYETGHDGTANGAIKLTADANTGRAQVTKTFTNTLDTKDWAGGSDKIQQDIVEAWVYVTDPSALTGLTLVVDINGASSQPFTEYFYYDFFNPYQSETDASIYKATAGTSRYLEGDYTVEGYDRETIRVGRREDGLRRGGVETPPPVLTAGAWTKVTVQRRWFQRVGSTQGCDWSTVVGLRIVATMAKGGSVSVIRVDDIGLVHGQLLGTYAYRYVLARAATSYTALSAPSDVSPEVNFSGQSAIVQIPPDPDRSTVATAIWVYRMGEDLDAFYKVATATLADYVNVAFATTADWEIGTINQSILLEAGCSNYTCADEPAEDTTLTFYGSANHVSEDEEDWLSDCGASETLAMTTGGIAVEDILADSEALVLDEPLETDTAPPPDSIIGIAGPYYDRLFCLTATTLFPSRTLNPESYSAGQAITVGSAEETAYWVIQALGGLYVGTSRDIYRLDGTLAELPDGTVEVQKVPLNIDHPPIGAAVVKDGPVVIYLAHDGWRAMTGSASTLLVGPTSLLYRGYTRHGLSPVNLATGRIRATATNGQFIAIIPEGSATTSSTVLYRYVFGLQRWYRHTYGVSWRSIAREPDGTLIAGDTAGTVWTLDTGTTDGGTNIAVTLWTRSEDDSLPFHAKEGASLSANLDTGGSSLAVAVHVDNGTTADVTGTMTSTGRGTKEVALTGMSQWHQAQLRLTGSFSTFYFGGYGLTYRAVPMGVLRWDSGPLDCGSCDLIWIRQVRVKVEAGADLTITPYFDGTAWPAVTAAVGTALNVPTILDAWLGRSATRGAYKGKVPRIVITSTAPFYPYWVELLKRCTSAQTDKQTLRFDANPGGR